MSGKTSIVLQLANSEYILSRVVKGDGTVEYQGQEVGGGLPSGETEFLTEEEYNDMLNRVPVAKRDDYIKVTYTRAFNGAGGINSLDDCQEVIILDYDLHSGHIAFRLEDGRIVNDTISYRVLWNEQAEDAPANWELFTTFNVY